MAIVENIRDRPFARKKGFICDATLFRGVSDADVAFTDTQLKSQRLHTFQLLPFKEWGGL